MTKRSAPALLPQTVPINLNVQDYSFPSSVVRFVQALKWCHVYSFDANGSTPCRILFYTQTEASTCQAHVAQVAFLLDVLLPVQGCTLFEAEIFLTPCRKALPSMAGRVLGENEINTGYAKAFEKLVVYREEEWCKVFIHETCHYLELDAAFPHAFRLDSVPDLAAFRIPTAISLAEVFCEVWARTLNCYAVARQSKKPVEGLLEAERQHAVNTMVQILAYMGLTYADLFTEKAARYQEDTNVFSYIVLGAIVLHSPLPPSAMQMTVAQMTQRISRNCRAPSFWARVARAVVPQGPGLRMSATRLFSD